MRSPLLLLFGLAACAVGAAAPVTAAAQSLPEAALDAELELQLTDDPTPVPAGMGALLVPTLTEGSLDPPVVVLAGEERVASGRTGRRIVVPPGRYTVLTGHGHRSQWARATVLVEEGITSPVPFFFGAVRVHIVDTRARPQGGAYVLRAIDLGTTYGPVSTSAEEDAPRAATWLLPPGRYVLALGTDPHADSDSLAFSVHAGEVLRYRLVVKGGQLVRSELHDSDLVYEPSIWRLRWTVGGSGMLDSRNGGLTHTGRQYVLLGLFSRLQVGIDTGPHLALLTFNADQSFVALDDDLGADIPFRTLQNEAELELMYTYRAARVIGPYVRAVARTSFFESHYYPDTDVVLNTYDEEGRLLRQGQGGRGDRIRLFEAAAPLVVQEGVGPSITVVDNDVVDLTFRAGAAARQAFYRNGRFVTGRSGDTVDLREIDDRVDGFGGEATAFGGLRLGRSFSIATKFDSFLPYQLFSGDEERFPFRWDSRATLGVGSYVSTSYTFSVRRDEVVQDEIQLTHGLALNVQAAIF